MQVLPEKSLCATILMSVHFSIISNIEIMVNKIKNTEINYLYIVLILHLF